MEVRRVVTAEQMKLTEEAAIRGLSGISVQILMSAAGKALAAAVKEQFPEGGNICILCGGGNNGGDGFAAAVLLKESGYTCSIMYNGISEKMSSASRYFYDVCLPMGIIWKEPSRLDSYDCILDCLIGTGFSGIIRPQCEQLISAVNSSGAYIISADIPSGLPSEGPVAPDCHAVKADCTVTMGYAKLNCVQYPGKAYTGKLIIADIGLAENKDHPYSATLADRSFPGQYRMRIPAYDAHKYTNGHAVIIGGLMGMEGAALLAANAAMETGVGLCTVISEESSRNIMAGKYPEMMSASVSGMNDARMADFFKTYFSTKKVASVLIGPGLGRGALSERIFRAATEAASGLVRRVIIDGDGLWLMSRDEKFFAGVSFDLIITPHAGEASRLLAVSAADITADPFSAALRLSQRYGCTAVVKGPTTVTAGRRERYINCSGNSALATGGTGDILAGICAALQMRDLSPEDAAAMAVYVHGCAAEDAAADGYPYLRSSAIIPYLRKNLLQFY